MRTERLLFAPWTEADWLALKPIATDPEVMRYISGGQPWPDDRIQEFVRRQIDGLRLHGYCMWQLLEASGGSMIGFCGLQPLAGTGDVEIGWWLARSHWGRGLATEAAHSLAGWLQARRSRPHRSHRPAAEPGVDTGDGKAGHAVRKANKTQGL